MPIASTVMSKPARATALRITGLANQVTRAPSRTPNCLTDVSKFANVLKSLGVERGDRVNIYMPMVPEAAVAMLACARIGAVHSVVFGGFSSDSLADRINDASAKVLVTADGGWRRGSVIPLKANSDVALENTPTITAVVVLRRTENEIDMQEGRDHWWHDFMAMRLTRLCEPAPMGAEDLLYLLYTSGTTAAPKGIMHTSAGYLLGRGVHAQVRVRHSS